MKPLLNIVAIFAMSETAMGQFKLPEGGTLIVFVLTIESSYAQDMERPSTNRFDTLQWWIGKNGAWRTKIYAVDGDIHVHEIKTEAGHADLIQLAKQNSEKHYRDVIAKTVSVTFPQNATDLEIKALLSAGGLRPHFDWFKGSCLLWEPDDSDYKSKTKPK